MNDDLLTAIEAVPLDADVKTGILISRSVTTGWLDWMHGELWLFHDGLLRVPMGWGKTFLCVAFFFNPRCLSHKTFDLTTFAHLISDWRNLWIPKDGIISATIGHTLGADELKAALADGRHVQLLWLTRDRLYYRLQPVLYAWIGDRLQVRG